MRRFIRMATLATIAAVVGAIVTDRAGAQVPAADDHLERVRAAVFAFLPEGFQPATDAIPSVSGPQPDWFGRAVYQVSTTALDAHSETWDLFFEVDARRFYVAGYMAVRRDAGRVLGVPAATWVQAFYESALDPPNPHRTVEDAAGDAEQRVLEVWGNWPVNEPGWPYPTVGKGGYDHREYAPTNGGTNLQLLDGGAHWG